MYQRSIPLKKQTTKEIRNAYYGFSWTAMFFTPFLQIFRKDLKGFILFFIVYYVYGSFAFPAIVAQSSEFMGYLTQLMLWIVVGLSYNKIHILILLNSGYIPIAKEDVVFLRDKGLMKSDYFTKTKCFRFISYVIDLLLMVGVCWLIDHFYPVFHFDQLSADIQVLKAATADVDINILASALANDFASISLKVVIVLEIYEFISLLIFQQTIGKAIFHLKLEKTDIFHTLLRCFWKGFSQIFLGGIMFLLSLFAIIASPRDIALHDRFAKTKVFPV